MPEIKEKSSRDRIKSRGRTIKLSRDLGQPMKDRAIRELRQQDPSHTDGQEQNGAGVYATDRLEDTARQIVGAVGSIAKTSVQHCRYKVVQIRAGQQEEPQPKSEVPTRGPVEYPSTTDPSDLIQEGRRPANPSGHVSGDTGSVPKETIQQYRLKKVQAQHREKQRQNADLPIRQQLEHTSIPRIPDRSPRGLQPKHRESRTPDGHPGASSADHIGYEVGNDTKEKLHRYQVKKAQTQQQEKLRQRTAYSSQDLPTDVAAPELPGIPESVPLVHHSLDLPHEQPLPDAPKAYTGGISEPQRKLWKDKTIRVYKEKLRQAPCHVPTPTEEHREPIPTIHNHGSDTVSQDHTHLSSFPITEHPPTTDASNEIPTPADKTMLPVDTKHQARAAGEPVSIGEQKSARTAIKERRINKTSIKERKNTGAAIKEHKRNAAVPARSKVKTASISQPPKLTAFGQRAAPRQYIKQAEKQARKRMQQKLVKQPAKTSVKAAKTVGRIAVKIGKALGAALVKGIGAIIAAGGGGVSLVVLLFVAAIAGIAASPFGLFFASEPGDTGAGTASVSIAEAVALVNADFNAQLETLQEGDYDSIIIEGAPPSWADVLAVFASKVAGAEDGTDVAAMDTQRIELLKSVFWDMTTITTDGEDTDDPDSDPDTDDDSEEKCLTITITSKTAEEMRTIYGFSNFQNAALTELLADKTALSALAGDLSITNMDAKELLATLPDDLPQERREVVEMACTLVGKVNYFWGGKSLTLGWDARWGQLQQVWADGSPTTGTYRPFGLDCSGFVDWVFYNATAGDYYPGHGGGTIAQHDDCVPIPWSSAQPGDLVFYPADEHVGIVGGEDADGNLLVIHCAAGYNNVVITGIEGFTAAARPSYYNG